jgi:hypothetical protein
VAAAVLAGMLKCPAAELSDAALETNWFSLLHDEGGFQSFVLPG